MDGQNERGPVPTPPGDRVLGRLDLERIADDFAVEERLGG